jgi:hypothetical protein
MTASEDQPQPDINNDIFTISKSVITRAAMVCASYALQLSLSSSYPYPAIAATNSQQEASSLFSKSNAALQDTEATYKAMENEFSTAKRLVDDSYRNIAKSVQTLQSISTELARSEEKLSKLIAVGEADITKITQEVDALTKSAGIKYAAAEASSEANAPPAKTATLFEAAQNEASILQEDIKQLKFFTDLVQSSQMIAAKTQTILTNLKGLDDSAAAALSEQQIGFDEVQQGIVSNIQVCRYNTNTCTAKGKEGLLLFKKGVATVTNAQDKYNRVLKSFETELRAANGVKSDFGRSLNKATQNRIDLNSWEKTSKLNLKAGKNLVNSYERDFEGITRNLEKKLDQFNKDYDRLSSKGKKENQAKFASVTNQLKTVQEKLEKAQNAGISAEKLLAQARARGMQEAAVYLKAMPMPSSTATTASSPVTTTSSTISTSSRSLSPSLSLKSK